MGAPAGEVVVAVVRVQVCKPVKGGVLLRVAKSGRSRCRSWGQGVHGGGVGVDVVTVAPLRDRWLEVWTVVEMDQDVNVVVGL